MGEEGYQKPEVGGGGRLPEGVESSDLNLSFPFPILPEARAPLELALVSPVQACRGGHSYPLLPVSPCPPPCIPPWCTLF